MTTRRSRNEFDRGGVPITLGGVVLYGGEKVLLGVSGFKKLPVLWSKYDAALSELRAKEAKLPEVVTKYLRCVEEHEQLLAEVEALADCAKEEIRRIGIDDLEEIEDAIISENHNLARAASELEKRLPLLEQAGAELDEAEAQTGAYFERFRAWKRKYKALSEAMA